MNRAMSYVHIPLNRLNWVEGDPAVLSSLKEGYSLKPLTPGLEAEVALVECGAGTFVAKLWNKESRPDIGRQYKLLSMLDAQVVRVSKPHGWGMDEEGNQLLLMEYGGQPLDRLDSDVLKRLARLLVDVHAFQVNQLPQDVIPTYDFVSYFFPALDQHPDIGLSLQKALDQAQYKQNALIHGDYNLANLLEQENSLMIIDWTNGQMGDPRYDAAWSIFLITVYSGEGYGLEYARHLQELGAFEQRKYSAFQAIACLRWLLLSRISDLPKGESAMNRIRAIISSNELLDPGLL
jgi:aminoglycoside phosphotransferase (APT) family kinase protein